MRLTLYKVIIIYNLIAPCSVAVNLPYIPRPRPGDKMQDKYNLNTNPNEGIVEEASIIDDPHGLQQGNAGGDKVTHGRVTGNTGEALQVHEITRGTGGIESNSETSYVTNYY